MAEAKTAYFKPKISGPGKERLMNAWEGLLAAPSGDFPRGPAPNRHLPFRPGMVAILLAMCLIRGWWRPGTGTFSGAIACTTAMPAPAWNKAT